jgi:methylenetetrahydrofolate reductase (NADPH)
LSVSFEFFPPKTDKMAATLWSSINQLAPLGPQFVSVTYGAGGSTRERTHATVARILDETSLVPAAHLTCVAASRDEVDEVIRGYLDMGVRRLVALRGDPVTGLGTAFEPHPDGYATAAELVAGIRRIGDFDISVSAYPESHPESIGLEKDLDILQAKIDAGASRAITQFFFDNDGYFRFLDAARARGIDAPIRPGLIPIHNFKQVAGFAARCGTGVPDWLVKRFEGLEDKPQEHADVAIDVAREQALALKQAGVREFHFYTLNRAPLVEQICSQLGLQIGDGDGQEEASS